MLFNFVVDWGLKRALANHPGVLPSDLAYVDDIALFVDDRPAAEASLAAVAHHSAMKATYQHPEDEIDVPWCNPSTVNLNGHPIDNVEQFTYILG